MNSPLLTNRTFDEIAVGDSATIERTVEPGDLTSAGDSAFSPRDFIGEVVARAIWSAASAADGARPPAGATIYLGQELKFHKPVAPGDTITATVSVIEKRADKQIVVLNTRCLNQRGEEVLTGLATVITRFERVEWPQAVLPSLIAAAAQHQDQFDTIVADAKRSPPLKVAVVHPCSPEAIQAAAEIREEGLLEPVLIGPEAKIRAAAAEAGIALDGFEIVCADHSHAAAERGVELAVAGKVAILMKGSLHSDELMGAVVALNSGLRTERRISHAYVMDVPAYPKLLVVTDAAINIAPTLEQKRDICQNAVDLLHLLGNLEPRVAVLAAVETVNGKMPATLDAAALTVMAARGQITGARVDGPLAFDNAISLDAARTKGIVSPVAGRADILLVPDLEAGNMLAKQLLYFAGADAAGLVLGARVPIILTSRSDSLKVRIASAALAKLMAAHRSAQGLPCQ